ncbi:MAG TPA: bifunctional DNA-formamidopyrimidine glycosylase/DNA-(apurinic or apyrimidinic site) lyase [Anaerolineales bacterium]|nr:bifunctional DNA-formamidopyrimidine glycosylase/DNA-(apurinic or apyrimidinic site) lyase [Anaerolineales bacterium]
MPELPEVETIVRGLRAPCVGRIIERATIKWKRHIAAPSAARFAERIRGQTIRAVNRRGKYLVFGLSAGTLLIHLKMSGDLSIVAADAPAEKHAHTIFHLDNETELRFSDPRKFGRVYLVRDVEEVTGQLGPEPLDESFTAAGLATILKSHRRQLKPLLLDQTVVAGIGNIYADESLHRARLHPQRQSDTVTPAEARALWRSIRRTLSTAIRNKGSSIDWMYRGGAQQNYFRVYGRAGEPCRVCGRVIRRILIGQRSTHFCPNCQRS